jgi:hypothetical protein
MLLVTPVGNGFADGPVSHVLFTFEKLRKTTVSLAMFARLSVRPSILIEQLAFHWVDFHEILYLSIFRKYVE